MPPPHAARQKQEAREAKLVEVRRQVEAGELVIRQATDAERAEWAAEGRGKGHADGDTIAVASINPAERAAALVGRVARYVESNPGASLNAVRRGIGGRAEYVAIALERLAATGYIERRREGRGYCHRTLRAFDPATYRPGPGVEQEGGGDARG